jgi:hypothetical protein
LMARARTMVIGGWAMGLSYACSGASRKARAVA